MTGNRPKRAFRTANAVRVIAIVEGLKGLIVVVAGFGLLSMVHQGAEAVAEQIVSRLHLDAAKDVPRIFLYYGAELNDKRLAVLAVLALVYAAGRLIEAYGLWFERAWAEWFAIVTAAIYIPFELFELSEGKILLSSLALLVNCIVLGIMVQAIRRPPDES